MIIKHKKTKINCNDCGKDIFVRNYYLKKSSKLCMSCAKRRNWEDINYRNKCIKSHIGQQPNPPLPFGEANFNNLFHSYKKNAQNRGISFLLTKEQFKYLTKQNCYYCGIEPLQKYGNEERFKYGLWLYNGIDRKDDENQYIINNCVPCCKKCNYMKQGLTDIEFFNQINKICKYHAELDTMGSRTISAK